jgi:hypothetical protein
MKENIIKIFQDSTIVIILLSWISWVVNYLYKQTKWDTWNWKMFFINTILAMYVWYGVFLLTPNNSYQLIIVMASAFTARDILAILETYVPTLLKWKLDKINK